MLSPRSSLSSLCFFLCVACSPSGGSLQIQLVTDYAPVRDFDTVGAVVEGASITRTAPAASDRSYGRPVRIATIDGLAPGRTRVTVSLSLGGRTIQMQPRFTDVRAGEVSIVTVPITRDCEGVACPGADAPSAIACLGGQCVDPGCSAAHPELCTATCAGGCAASAFACVTRACGVEGVCVDTTDDSRCAPGEICVANLGCHAPFSSADDAGVSDAGVGDSGVVDINIEDFAVQLGQHICSALSLCLGPAEDDVALADCAREFSNVFLGSSVPQLYEAESNGTFHYDGTFAAACLAALDSTPCENLVSGYPAVCENALLGRVAVGGTCDLSFECVGDAFCNPDGDGVCPFGTCAARRGAGGACSAAGNDTADQQCERGLRCVGGVCTVPVAMGASCTTGNQCAPGAFCVGSGGARHCGTQAEQYAQAAGAACNLIEGPLCMRPLSCTGVCSMPVTSGAACSPGVPDMCPTGEYCDHASHVCSPLPGDGSACLDGTYLLSCSGGLYCGADHVCHDLRANGMACTSANECASHTCTAMACAPTPLCQ